MSDIAPRVFLPGLCDDVTMWSAQRSAFDGIVETSAVDLLDDTDIGAAAQRVLSVAPPRFTLVGFSMGGYVAFEILRQQPSRVAALALLSTSARADTPDRIDARKAMQDQALDGDYLPLVDELIPHVLLPSGPRAEQVASSIRTMARRIGAAGFSNQLSICMSRPDSRSLLPGIACPTLVLCGADDTLTPPDLSQEMADAIPSSQMVLIEACGHYSPMEQPGAVNAALKDWLQIE